MYKEFKQLNLTEIGKEILTYWQNENIFQQSITSREGNPTFTFYEGPPSANGMPGIHHVMARAIKDIFCRYKTLKGFQVKRKGGWDTHGLPIELAVEKKLNITKEDIGTKISVEAYNQACKQEVMKYTDVWNDLTEKMGYWVDLENPYITYEKNYIESLWWILKELYKKDLLYKGYTIQPYSPAAGTGLSSHELNQPGTYRDVTDTTITAQFKAINSTLPIHLQSFGTVYFLAWTTTPWTLPSNTALTVGPKIAYVWVKTFNQYTFEPIQVILAKALVAKQFSGKYFLSEAEEDFTNYQADDKKIPYQILSECLGSDLIGVKYEQLLPLALPYQQAENAFRVIGGDFVTTEDGTGIVHTAPTFGADDARVAKAAIPEIPPMLVLDSKGNPVPLVNLQGKFVESLPDFGGKYVKNEYYADGTAPEKSVDVEIAIRLKEENKAFKVEKYVHSYPHCWRTDKPVLYYPLDSWFIKTTAVKDRLVALNKTINWKPEATGTGRFGNWLENLVDWNLSRSRYWGTPLPIWRTEEGDEELCIGSLEELHQEIQKAIQKGFMPQGYVLKDVHRPYVDEIILVSPSGKKMQRELDLIDVWFDSGAMPYAQWHYPFENKEIFNTAFPADFIAEGVDQTRGWFFTLHAIATMLMDNVAFKNVVSNGLVLDKNGNKMSKRLGNAVDPFSTIETYSADATRWYMISNASPWDNLKFNLEGLDEVRRKFFGTLYNTYAFFALYANIDQFKVNESEQTPIANRSELDRWILSLLQELISTVEENYESYEPTKAARAIQEFVDEHLSNWYVRLSRRRFWKGEMTEDKKSAYETLHTCLSSIAQLMSPVAPFFADWLYRNLTHSKADNSVHLSHWKNADKTLLNKELNTRMQIAQDISSLVLSLRKKSGINVRQPLAKILIPILDPNFKAEVELVKDIILSETNIKNIEYISDTQGIISKKIKPNFKALGPKVGKDMKLVADAIQQLNQEDINIFEKNGSIAILEGKYSVDIAEVEIIAEDVEGWQVANLGKLTVALDIHISPELKQEGLSRELINRIQNLRKELDFEVTDKINVEIENHPWIAEVVNYNQKYICSETLATNLQLKNDISEGNVITIEEQTIHIKISKN